MTLKPWAIGPFELLQHAEVHRLSGGDFDRRMALISFDNAIESSIATYLSLDPVQRGGRPYPREDVTRWLTNFHSKLAFLEQHALSLKRPMKQDRASIVFYHRLRNELYHDGNGVVPAERHLNGIREAALWTFSLLFECDAEELLHLGGANESMHVSEVKLSEATAFLQIFLSIREALTNLASAQFSAVDPALPTQDSLQHVATAEQDPSLAAFVDDLRRAEQVTDALVDGVLIDSNSTKLPELTQKLEVLSKKLDERLRAHQRDAVLAAIQATVRAAAGNRRAGVVCQAIGSGRTASLVAYVAACCEEFSLPFLQYIVVFDRALAVDQFIEAYNKWLSPASPRARAARGLEFAMLLQNKEVGPLVVTVQQLLSQGNVYEQECLVVYEGYTNPPPELENYFPLGTFIRFTTTMYTKASDDSSWGGIIHAYDIRQALQDGFSLPLRIEVIDDASSQTDTAITLSLPLHRAQRVEQRAQSIVDDYLRHPDGKAIVLVADLQLVQEMSTHLNAILDGRLGESETGSRAVGIGSFMKDAPVRQALQKFSKKSESPEILVMTPPRIIGLDISIVTCYVTCSVPPAMRVSVASLVSRPRPGKSSGRIVDYVNNLWDMEQFMGSTI